MREEQIVTKEATDRTPPGRALTPAHKRRVVKRLLAAWSRAPHLRLGQLLHCGMSEVYGTSGQAGVVWIEDDELATCVEAFVERVPARAQEERLAAPSGATG